jgi:hypothetical protein
MFKGTSAWRLRLLALLLPVLVSGLAFGQANASAATIQGCTPSMTNDCSTATVDANHKQINFSGTLQTGTNGNSMPTCPDRALAPCAPGTNDTPCASNPPDANLVCEHFRSLTAAVAGTVQVCVSFPPTTMFGDMNDVDVYIVDTATGAILGTPGTSATANPECATADLTAGQEVQIIINPSFVMDVMVPIAGTITFAPKLVFTSSCFKFHGHHERGSGEDDHHGKFHGEGHRDDARGEKDGKANYRNDDEGYHFYSTHVDDVQFTQLGTALNGNPIMQMVMTGEGVNNGQAVTFVITMVDAGLGGPGDSFLISTSDGQTGGGNVTNGSNHYHHYAD